MAKIIEFYIPVSFRNKSNQVDPQRRMRQSTGLRRTAKEDGMTGTGSEPKPRRGR